MTKKHFKELALCLAAVKPTASEDELVQWMRDVKAVCTVCSRASDRFDQSQFLKAVGMDK
jgi:hypothetical protein